MKPLYKPITALCVAFLCACGSSSSDDTEVVYTNLLSSIGTNELSTSIDVNTKLAEAADSVSHSLHKLAELELTADNTKHTPAKHNSFDKIPNMHQISSVEWNGPVGPIISKIAQASKHKLTVLGRTPSVPVIVNLDMKNVQLAEIMQNVAYQAAGHIRISYNEKHNAFELRYLNK